MGRNNPFPNLRQMRRQTSRGLNGMRQYRPGPVNPEVLDETVHRFSRSGYAVLADVAPATKFFPFHEISVARRSDRSTARQKPARPCRNSEEMPKLHSRTCWPRPIQRVGTAGLPKTSNES